MKSRKRAAAILLVALATSFSGANAAGQVAENSDSQSRLHHAKIDEPTRSCQVDYYEHIRAFACVWTDSGSEPKVEIYDSEAEAQKECNRICPPRAANGFAE